MVLRAGRPTDKPDRTVVGSGGYWVVKSEAQSYLDSRVEGRGGPKASDRVEVRMSVLRSKPVRS